MASNGLGIDGLVLREREPKQRLGHLEEEEARGLVSEARGLVTTFTCVASERGERFSSCQRNQRFTYYYHMLWFISREPKRPNNDLGTRAVLEYPMGLGFIEHYRILECYIFVLYVCVSTHTHTHTHTHTSLYS